MAGNRGRIAETWEASGKFGGKLDGSCGENRSIFTASGTAGAALLKCWSDRCLRSRRRLYGADDKIGARPARGEVEPPTINLAITTRPNCTDLEPDTFARSSS